MAKGNSKLSQSSGNSGGGLYGGLYVEGSAGQYQKEADEIVTGAKDVLADFGFDDELQSVYFNTKGTIMSGDATASMNGAGGLTINTKELANNKSSDGYFTSDTFYGTGAHEGGHGVINALLKNNVLINPNETNKTPSRANLERATARSKGKLEKAVIKEAQKRYGSNPKISGYGSQNVVEKVAEAVSDVYANKNKANPYSKEIVGVLKDIKNGKFTPVITVSKREMGI